MGSPKIFNFWGEEKWRQAKLACEFLLASPFRRGTLATTTTMACLVGIRMRITISNTNFIEYENLQRSIAEAFGGV